MLHLLTAPRHWSAPLMHELSIASAIVDIVGSHAEGRRVTAVSVRIGHLRQVVPSALELAFELIAQGTKLQGARLELHSVPPAGRCSACGTSGPLDVLPVRCQACGALEIELTAGEELSVEEIEVETEASVEGRPGADTGLEADERPGGRSYLSQKATREQEVAVR